MVDAACLVAQVQHHLIAYRFVGLVGVDVWSEGLDAALLVGFEERRADEADQVRAGDDGGVVTLAREESPEIVGFDVSVVLTFVPVAEESIAVRGESRASTETVPAPAGQGASEGAYREYVSR